MRFDQGQEQGQTALDHARSFGSGGGAIMLGVPVPVSHALRPRDDALASWLNAVIPIAASRAVA